MPLFKESELKETSREYWILQSIKVNQPTYDNSVMYQDYRIYMDTNWFGKWTFVHDSYDGAPDAKDNRHGFGSSIDDCIKQINEYILENEVEP